jgi:hypothetical protein
VDQESDDENSESIENAMKQGINLEDIYFQDSPGKSLQKSVHAFKDIFNMALYFQGLTLASIDWILLKK